MPKGIRSLPGLVALYAYNRTPAYDDLQFASGDGVCLAKAAMFPEGYRCAEGGRVKTERGHVGLLGDLEAVGRFLLAVVQERRQGVGLGGTRPLILPRSSSRRRMLRWCCKHYQQRRYNLQQGGIWHLKELELIVDRHLDYGAYAGNDPTCASSASALNALTQSHHDPGSRGLSDPNSQIWDNPSELSPRQPQ